MLKAVLFDIGGVIVRTENLEPRRVWERRLGLLDWGLAKIVFENEAAQRATLGQAPYEAPWEAAAQQLNLTPADVAQLKEDFWKGDVYDAALLAFIAALRPRYKTGIISNAWTGIRAFHQPHINETQFDLLMYSAEEGVAKPAAEIYERALARLGVRAAEAVFVDDVPENIAGAQAVGMAGIRFLTREQTLADLRQGLGLF